ncbi:hypothetical protein HBH69_181900 [Parastagonospora nodorum]|nr:hypothetical protein HBH69_181900 [Parastagonospora nodorum]
MATESKLLSQTLQSITKTKMREQHKRQQTFEASKSKLLTSCTELTNDLKRVKALLDGYKELACSNKGVAHVDEDREDMMKNIAKYIEQAHHDPSVSSETIAGIERTLQKKLEQEGQRLEFANLYYRLLAEWTDASSKPMEQSEEKEASLDGAFEHVQKYDLQKLTEKFASVVFTPLETDEVEIDNYLNGLFEDDHAQRVLKYIREDNAGFASLLKKQTKPFDPDMLKKCIKALLANNLLNDDAKSTLSEFATDEVVLDEIADVLNLRFADLDNWSWQAEDEGMYYEPRRQLNGKYRIMMDMDILQAIFLHFIAMSWCAQLKLRFEGLVEDSEFWRQERGMSDEEKARYSFFVGGPPHDNGMQSRERKKFVTQYLNSSLPSSLDEGGDPYGEDGDAGRASKSNEPKTGLALRQAFLQQLATNVIIRRELHGEVAVVQSDLQWYATGLPHSTLWAVLRFWGIPDDFIALFKKYAEAPLRMTATPGENVRTRRRGIPITDAFETLFGEIVLFCMDVAVNRLSGMTMTRFHDDLYLYGAPKQTSEAWKTIEMFVKVLGLDINTSKTGSVYISDGAKDDAIAAAFPEGPVGMGMLQLNNKGDWNIDQNQVAAHTRQLHKQLGQCTSIMSWIQTWNACIGRFFQDTFGKPANCFGQAHIKAILDTHTQIQSQLFDSYGGSSIQYLRQQLESRFGVTNIPDSFFFLLEELGGLGLANPFIPFLAAKHYVKENPRHFVTAFQKQERITYKAFADEFATLSKADKQRRYRTAFVDIKDNESILEEPFFGIEEYCAHRETHSSSLLLAYEDLLQEPNAEYVRLTIGIQPWFEEMKHTHGRGWHDLDSRERWIMNLYADELKDKFGALSVVDKNLLPSGVLKMLEKRKITWQMVIWE